MTVAAVGVGKLNGQAGSVFGLGDETVSPQREDTCLFAQEGFGHLPVCVAKTQYSFTADPTQLGAPSGHVLPLLLHVLLCTRGVPYRATMRTDGAFVCLALSGWCTVGAIALELCATYIWDFGYKLAGCAAANVEGEAFRMVAVAKRRSTAERKTRLAEPSGGAR